MYSPRVIGQVNDYDVKVAHVKTVGLVEHGVARCCGCVEQCGGGLTEEPEPRSRRYWAGVGAPGPARRGLYGACMGSPGGCGAPATSSRAVAGDKFEAVVLSTVKPRLLVKQIWSST